MDEKDKMRDRQLFPTDSSGYDVPTRDCQADATGHCSYPSCPKRPGWPCPLVPNPNHPNPNAGLAQKAKGRWTT